MMSNVPSPPDGPYPQDVLWGHIGNAPNSMSIKITSKIVPSMINSPSEVQIEFCCVERLTDKPCRLV